MPAADLGISRFYDLIAKWRAHRAPLTDPDLSCQIKDDLKQVRNPGWNGNPPLSSWPALLVDSDDGMNAAVEHYFLCRCWVGSGKYPAWQMRSMSVIYDAGKYAGVTPSHNPAKPTTPLTPLQVFAKALGVKDGEADLLASKKSAPLFGAPPKY
jgi:hypothetical protein